MAVRTAVNRRCEVWLSARGRIKVTEPKGLIGLKNDIRSLCLNHSDLVVIICEHLILHFLFPFLCYRAVQFVFQICSEITKQKHPEGTIHS